MRSIGIGKKISLTLAIILILVVSVILIAALIDNGSEVSKAELSNVEKILENLPSISQDIGAVKSVSDNNADVPLQRTIKRYTTLKDVDNDNDYLYTEFNEGGYAIYDRIGEFLYERSDFGEGPYSNVFNSKDIYYGGPSYYYIKNNNEFYELVNSRKTPRAELAQLTAGIEDIRQDYLDGEISTLSLNAASTMAASQLYNLGVGISDSELSQTAQWYFITYAMLLNYGYDQGATLQVFGDNIEVPLDTHCGKNYFGSCVSVALGLAMKYYDDLGVADMIPDDLSGFHTMYDFKFATSNELMSKYHEFDDGWLNTNGKLMPYMKFSKVSTNELRTERVHQELLYQNFPQFVGLDYDALDSLVNLPFGYLTANVGSLYKKYAQANGLKDYKFVAENDTYWLPENIVAGNPCIVSLKPGTPYLDNTLDDGHAVLAYAFTGAKPLWYTVNEVVCNMGWDSRKEYGCVYINSNYIRTNVRANIF